MSETFDEVMQSVRQEAETRARTLERLLGGADASRVFGPPVTNGAFTVIPAAEIACGGGLGSGMGVGGPGRRKKSAAEPLGGRHGEAGTGATDVSRPAGEGAGGGGGGGGGSMGRPVAAIIIGPDGVVVRPVVDVTKLVLTGLGVLTAASALVARMARKKAG